MSLSMFIYWYQCSQWICPYSSLHTDINAVNEYMSLFIDWLVYFWCLTPLSAISWRKKPESPERTTDHGQATGKLYHLRLRVECTFFSSPDPKGHVRYCHHLASVVRRLSSVVRRPSVNFSYFNLLLWNNWTKWNQTWQKASI